MWPLGKAASSAHSDLVATHTFASLASLEYVTSLAPGSLVSPAWTHPLEG